jgi:hypothetical protein
MITLTQGLHPQLEERKLTQQAVAIVVGCFPAFRDQFLTHCPIIPKVRAANREKRNSVREL